jgi:hypothetical protein
LDNLDNVWILLALPQSDHTVVKGYQEGADGLVVWEVDACDAGHLVEIKNGVHVLDI